MSVLHYYPQRSKGDNALGSVRLSVHPFETFSCLNRLTFDLHYRLRSEGDNVLGSVRPSVSLSVCGHSHGLKLFVCVSVISGHMRIIARMRLIGVLIVPLFLKLDILYQSIVPHCFCDNTTIHVCSPCINEVMKSFWQKKNSKTSPGRPAIILVLETFMWQFVEY